MSGIEGILKESVNVLRLAVEAAGMAIIAIGALGAAVGYVRTLIRSDSSGFTDVRLSFARHLVLALEFQLASDLLSTAMAPGWPEIGMLAAVAAIRTFLNYFLNLEMQQEQREQRERS